MPAIKLSKNLRNKGYSLQKRWSGAEAGVLRGDGTSTLGVLQRLAQHVFEQPDLIPELDLTLNLTSL